MLEMNLKANINNANYIRYMEYQESGNGESKCNLESERATSIKKDKKK